MLAAIGIATIRKLGRKVEAHHLGYLVVGRLGEEVERWLAAGADALIHGQRDGRVALRKVDGQGAGQEHVLLGVKPVISTGEHLHQLLLADTSLLSRTG